MSLFRRVTMGPYRFRFDTTCLTWRHPSLSRERLSELLFDRYRKFFSLRHALHNMKDEMVFRSRCVLARSAANMATSLFSRYCAWRRTHPMSGGIKRVRLDGNRGCLALGAEVYGLELAPMPQSLTKVGTCDSQRVKLVIVA